VVHATILVDRPNHKGIVIGGRGARLGEIGRRARLELEAVFGTKVFLELFVRVEPGWAKDPRRLEELGLRWRARPKRARRRAGSPWSRSSGGRTSASRRSSTAWSA